MKTVSYLKHPKYDYVLTSDLEYRCPWELGNHDFEDEFGNVWLQMRGKLIIVKAGYAWDGASYAPDLPDFVLASCVHDALCNFRDVPCFPLSKARIDWIFRDNIPPHRPLRWVYWAAVRTFGGAYKALAGGRAAVSCGLSRGHSRDSVTR